MSTKCSDDIQFEEDHFGLFTDKATGQSTSVRRFTWRNSNNITVQVITYGATITSIKVPDKSGKIEDVVLGFNDVQGKLFPLARITCYYCANAKPITLFIHHFVNQLVKNELHQLCNVALNFKVNLIYIIFS